ncbi:hypothetical protein ACC691_38815, partial [Rhizobium johnstonii]|uniref:hypothetical protein n=1 Tax=Rhizobium johnstonii TaxID=3019933 RepID=UPI003F952AA2
TTQKPSTDLQNYAAWLENGSSIAIVLYGSSGCPSVGQSMVVRASNSLRVTTVPIPADKACTADYAPHTTVFPTPPGMMCEPISAVPEA